MYRNKAQLYASVCPGPQRLSYRPLMIVILAAELNNISNEIMYEEQALRMSSGHYVE